MKTLVLVFCNVLALLLIANACSQQKTLDYKVEARHPIAGEGGWDALTAGGGKVYLSRGTVVQIVDEKTGKLVGTIPGTAGVHGIALAPEFDKGFTSDGRSNCVTVFSLKTQSVLTRIPVTGTNPDGIYFDSFSKQVFVFNGRTSNVTVINAKENKATATIPLAGKPEFATSDGNGTIFVNIEDKSIVSAINAKTLKVVTNWTLTPGKDPSGIAIDTNNHRLFVACRKLLVVLDARSGTIVTNLSIRDRVDGAEFDPILNRVYAPSGEGYLTVIQEKSDGSFKELGEVPTQKSARTIAIDVETHHVFLPAAEFSKTQLATNKNPHPHPLMKPGSFVLLEIAPGK